MAWLLALALLLLALTVGSRLIASITILEYERALKFVRGRYVELTGPGHYWYLPQQTRYQRVDTRLTYQAVSGQEVLSADGVALKVSLLAAYRVSDPKTAVLETMDLQGAVHACLQLALRSVIAGRTSEELLQRRAELTAPLHAESAPQLAQLGVELQTVALRDLTLPGDLKKVFSQIVQARQEGLASLERARGETAALRSLANAAQLMERHPQLLQLRLLQVLSSQPGHTVVLGNPPPLAPIVVPSTTRPAPPSEESD
jgi:regulator of protease activity HflC (stomatin/prohibitin superfamily)